MAARTISISYPGSNSTLGSTFYVQGNCSLHHAVKVDVNKASDGTTAYTANTTVTQGTNIWSAAFSGVVAGTYNIVATCGEPPVSAEAGNITVA